jgi:hypothetical protein
MTRVRRQPEEARSSRNSFSVRSRPPGKISIWRSRNFPGASDVIEVVPRSLRSVAGTPNYGVKEKAGHSGRDDSIGKLEN